MKKQTWKIAAFVILGIGAAASFLVVRPMESKSPPLRRGMFEWQEERVVDRKDVDELIGRFQITDWVQELSVPVDRKTTAAFGRDLHQAKVKTYALVGETDWGYEADGASLIAYLEELVRYNDQVTPAEQLVGVMVDVEPYTRSRLEGRSCRTHGNLCFRDDRSLPLRAEARSDLHRLTFPAIMMTRA